MLATPANGRVLALRHSLTRKSTSFDNWDKKGTNDYLSDVKKGLCLFKQKSPGLLTPRAEVRLLKQLLTVTKSPAPPETLPQ
jgi:hypothetical protein